MRGEYRPDRFCSAHGPLALLRVSEVCRSLSRRCSRQRLLLPGPVSGDGFRSVDLPRELARYRGMLAFDERQAVPHGLPWPSGTHHAGRCQREPRLADLRRLRAGVDRHRPATLCPRSHRRRLGAQSLRVGFHDHRSMPDAVPVGQVPQAQSRRQNAHAAGPARQHPHVYQHYGWQSARRQHPRRDLSGGRSVLRNGPRLRRFRAPPTASPSVRPSSSCAPNPTF